MPLQPNVLLGFFFFFFAVIFTLQFPGHRLIFLYTGSMYKNLMEGYFALKISFLIFWRPKNSVLKVS